MELSLIETLNGIKTIIFRLTMFDDKQILLNARSYRGSIARTDHRVVVTTIDLSKYHSRIQPLQKQKPRPKQVNRSSLPTTSTLQTLYQTTLQQLIIDTPAPHNTTPNKHWTLLQHQIKTAITATLLLHLSEPPLIPSIMLMAPYLHFLHDFVKCD